jgi:nucleotide-binding universal stress UspA family protein
VNKVLACVDGSVYSQSVCEHAAWAAQRLAAPLEFLHVLDRHPETAITRDLSGNIGLDSQDHLLAELSELDQHRSKLAQRRGREMLDSAVRQANSAGIVKAESKLRHGGLVDSLTDLEKDVRLFVLGKRGEHADFAKMHLGSELERAVRAVHRPLLVASRQFKPIQRFLIAFDGSQTTRKGVEMIAASPLLKALECHVVTAGNDSPEIRSQWQWAQELLAGAGFDTQCTAKPGAADSVISEYVSANGIDLLVMGAYGHSRIRQLIVGSTTTAMIRTCLIPVLLLR